MWETMQNTHNLSSIEGLGEGEYVFQNEDGTIETIDTEMVEVCKYLENEAEENIECVEESDGQEEI